MTYAREEQHKRRIWALESSLGNVGNLAAALEVVSWQLCQSSVPDDVEDLKQLRDAVVGISRALAVETEAAFAEQG